MRVPAVDVTMSEIQQAVTRTECTLCVVLSATQERLRLEECLKTQAELCARIAEQHGATEAAACIRAKFGKGGI